jgi:Tfp pilus assembly protein PilX
MESGIHLGARNAMPTPRFTNEDGASLVIVLVFITVFGLIAAGLLTEAGASVAYTKTVNDHEKKVYAADAGVALGIQHLQQHNTLCPVTGSSGTIQTVKVNGLDTEVTCETTSGSTTGGLGYAIYTLSDEPDSLQLQQGDAKEVSGPVHVTGGVTGLNKGLDLTKGDFTQLAANGCNAKTYSGVGGVTPQPGYDKYCLSSQPEQPTYSAPSAAIPAPAPTPQLRGDCKIFYPGTYDYSLSDMSLSTAFNLTKTNYFATGVYYFRSSFSFTGTGSDDTYYFGGMPADYEAKKFSSKWDATTCARDTEAVAAAASATTPFTYTPSGSGVEFVFGNGAILTVENKSRAELFERTADGNQETASPTIAVVPSTWATTPVTWQANPIHTTGVTFTPGADKALVVHGVTYAPEHNVLLKVTNVVDAVAFGGIVAWKLDLDSSEGGGGSGLVVNGRNGTPKPRRIIVKGTAPPASTNGAGRSVVSTAVISIENDESKTVQIETWRTRAPNQDL